MNAWQSILVALGGNAILLIALGWLARSLGSQILAKDLERFKSELAATSHTAIERSKHELQMLALEHEVRFSKLHEKRASVVAEIYGLLVEAHWASQSFVSAVGFAGDPPKSQQYNSAMNASAEFYRFFEKNRIYLPTEVCRQLDEFIRNIRKEMIGFGIYATAEDGYLPESAVQKKYDAWIKVGEYFSNEVPKARELLETELRKLIGAQEK